MDYLGTFGPKWFRWPQSREVPVKGKGFSQIWIILELLAQSGSSCPNQEKKYELDWLSWGNGKFGFWVMCPWMSIEDKEGNFVIMVKDLKRILGIVSLDIYQITNYSIFQKSISFAWFSKDSNFSWTSKCDYVKPSFISKSDYLKCQCFGSTGSEGGKVFIWMDLFPTMITNFQF